MSHHSRTLNKLLHSHGNLSLTLTTLTLLRATREIRNVVGVPNDFFFTLADDASDMLVSPNWRLLVLQYRHTSVLV
jgi:hypothetical protein